MALPVFEVELALVPMDRPEASEAFVFPELDARGLPTLLWDAVEAELLVRLCVATVLATFVVDAPDLEEDEDGSSVPQPTNTVHSMTPIANSNLCRTGNPTFS